MGASHLAERIAEKWLARINMLSGGGLAIFGFVLLLGVALGY